MIIRKIDSLALYQLKPLSTLMFKFMVEAKEHEATVERLMHRFNECEGKWVMIEKGKMCGYFSTSIQKNIYGRLFTFVEGLYVDKTIRKIESIRKMEKTIVDWTKAQGINQIIFNTRRNARAFMRLLNTKFIVDSMVLSACL